MKKIMRILTTTFILGMLAFSVSDKTSAATTDDIRNACQYHSVEKVNPDFGTMNCLLTQTALAYNVPPEIVKAIAEKESGDWKHFDENGEAIITDDNGIGIMQITNKSGFDEELLKNDIAYNIKAGVEILDYMFKRTDLPTINTKERDVIEHWYFAIMAYNGTKPVNSPVVQATGAKNTNAYQEKVLSNIKNYSLIELADLPFKKEDFRYDPNSTANIEFATQNYFFNVAFTKSKHFLKNGQKVVTTTATRLRPEPTTTGTNYKSLAQGEVLTITGPFVYDKDKSKKNHFVWYPVKRQDGTTGYVASSYLKYRFKDVNAGHYAEKEIDYLVDRGMLKGVGDDKFGMGVDLPRWQAAVLLARAKNLSLDNRPDPGFVDVPKNFAYYREIAAVVDEGYFKGLPGNKFNPNVTLTRAEMATVLQRIFNFPEATKTHTFKDIKEDWYADAVARLYSAGITTGVDAVTFGSYDKITREQFAVFMVRSMDESFRK